MSIETIKKQILPILKSNDIKFAGVFGSCARNQANEKSDLDLLVKFSKPKTFLNLVRLENQLSQSIDRKVDLVTEGSLSPYIKDQVLLDLKILYGER